MVVNVWARQNCFYQSWKSKNSHNGTPVCLGFFHLLSRNAPPLRFSRPVIHLLWLSSHFHVVFILMARYKLPWSARQPVSHGGSDEKYGGLGSTLGFLNPIVSCSCIVCHLSFIKHVNTRMSNTDACFKHSHTQRLFGRRTPNILL